MQLLHPQTLLPILLTLTPLSSANPNSNSSPEMPQQQEEQNQQNLSNLISTPSFSPHQDPAFALEDRQVAAGGGIVATTLAPSQYPISTTAGSLFTVNGVTSATWTLFVQTFATTALGTWELGPTPQVGSIGLGDIVGTVGSVRKVERAWETNIPVPKA